MSFEKINNVSLDNTHERSCIMIINFNNKESALIKNISNFMGIRDQVILDNKNGNSLIKDILNNDISTDCEDGLTNKAIIFNNIAHTKVNAFLESLKKMRINRPLTAMVTETSIDWTLNKVIMNLVEERKAMANKTTINHK